MFAMSGSDQKTRQQVYLSNKHLNNLLHGSYHLKEEGNRVDDHSCKDTTQSID